MWPGRLKTLVDALNVLISDLQALTKRKTKANAASAEALSFAIERLGKLLG